MGFVTWELDDRVAIVTLDRPPANALSSVVINDLNEVLQELERQVEVRVIVVRGEGRFFSAGADIKEFAEVTIAKDMCQIAENAQTVFERIESFPKPVLAAVHGAALGGGLELAMSCHMRFVTEDVKLGLPELQLGIIPIFAGTQRLPRYVGAAKAAEMMLTSESISGIEALQWGLVNRVYSAETLMLEVMAVAKKIAEKSPLTLRATIELLQHTKTDSFYEGVRAEVQKLEQLLDSEDAKEGIQAFIEKRKPSFMGK